MTAAGIIALVGLAVTVASLVWLHLQPTRVAISWFPMDPPGAKWTRTGWMHFVLAFVAFACVLAAASVLGAVLSHPGTWHALAPVSVALGYAMTACLAMFGLAQTVPALRARFGAIERGFYLFAITWCAVFAFACAAGVR